MLRKRKAIVVVEPEHKFDAERLRKQAAALGAVAQVQAAQAAKQAAVAREQAAHLAELSKDWATPRVEAAAAWAGPKVDKAWRETVKATAPKVEHATERVRPAVDNAYERIVDDYLPRVQKAMHDAADAAAGGEGLSGKASKAGRAARKALSEPPQKSHGLGKTLGWVLVGTAAAGTGYLLWRRSQPVDDPWAEEYWEDTTVTSPAASTESGTAGGTASTVKEKVGEAKEKVAGAADSSGAKPGQTWEADTPRPGQEHKVEDQGPSGTTPAP
ncbi:hypothetical protein KZX45_07370 [Georgenia sp. EYE_87]|uniref:hypothetical protein n=1 Tax=Georgenia sp. EYE_87 TaxID=2853448 RepID=UPI0020044DEF|nr:hypothetical protein [Georgenia sp. EYE_87]MCK6210360.1 hypothetical protein [Georgenia sp. EYE_87]